MTQNAVSIARWQQLVLVALLFCLSWFNTASAGMEQQRALFQRASEALKNSRVSEFNVLFKQLEGYPLRPYLVYDAFNDRLDRADPADMSLFFESHAEYPFIYTLRTRWLSELARREDWQHFLQFYDGRTDTRLKCLALQARLNLGQIDAINEDIEKIWLSGYSQPDECDKPFEYLLETVAQPQQVIWLRIEKAFNVRRPHLAKYLGNKLEAEDQVVVQTWYQAHQQPEQALVGLAQADDDPRVRKMIVHALDRLARKDALKARQTWFELAPNFEFDQSQQDQLAKRIAISAAIHRLPEARDLLSSLTEALKNDQASLLLARIYLRAQDWPELIDTINRMPEHLQQENEWQYWLARAFESLGNEATAMTKFNALAQKSSYYGFLSADRLQLTYRIEQENVAVIEGINEAEFLAANPYMLRARELYFLDRLLDAKREWFQALRHLDTGQIKQAAALASKWKWHDSAIKTVAKTSHRRDYSLRFPMPYKEQVFQHASDKQLDPSVIYGVMRRESLFDPFAKSRVGALGLMQLMPSTARHVARNLGMERPGQSDILNVENNINFGTQYFRSVLDRFDNNVSLAAAAYNAGPGNVKRWLPTQDALPADLWVETVPYKETRNYVQAVLAYATVFDKSLGRDTLISSRMGEVKSEY